MKKHWRTMVPILVAAGVLSFFLRGLMRENIVAPLAYLVWVGHLIFLSIPQAGIWVVFILITLIIALRSLIKKQKLPPPAPRPVKGRVKRIASWAKIIRQKDEDYYYRWQLAQQLQKLTVDALAIVERVECGEIRRRLEHGAIADMSPQILAYLQAGVTSFAYLADKKPRFGFVKPASPLDLDPALVIQYLEDKVKYGPN